MGIKRLMRKMRRTFFGFRNEEVIEKTRAALRRHEARVEKMRQTWAEANAPCCPGCMFGAEYTEAMDQCTRTAMWLHNLLERRGTDEDKAEMQSLEWEYPPCAAL